MVKIWNGITEGQRAAIVFFAAGLAIGLFWPYSNYLICLL